MDISIRDPISENRIVYKHVLFSRVSRISCQAFNTWICPICPPRKVAWGRFSQKIPEPYYWRRICCGITWLVLCRECTKKADAGGHSRGSNFSNQSFPLPSIFAYKMPGKCTKYSPKLLKNCDESHGIRIRKKITLNKSKLLVMGELVWSDGQGSDHSSYSNEWEFYTKKQPRPLSMQRAINNRKTVASWKKCAFFKSYRFWEIIFVSHPTIATIITPLKINMEPRIPGLEDDFPFQTGDVQVPVVKFWGCNFDFIISPTKPGTPSICGTCVAISWRFLLVTIPQQTQFQF